jgi:hypothetical protein
LNDTRCDFYIPPKGTIIKSWFIETDVALVDSTTQLVVAPAITTGASAVPHSCPSAIERHYWLHGNSAGDILYEITNHAHHKLESVMQGFVDPSEFGYIICTDEEDGLYDGVDKKSNSDKVTIAGSNDDTLIGSEYYSQLIKIQKERQWKYRHFGRRVADYNVGKGTSIFCSSDILPQKMNHWPHMLCS